MRFLFAAFLILQLTACATSGNSRLLDEALVDQIVVGETTKAKVRNLLGTPQTRYQYSSGGLTQDTWGYSYTSVETNPALFIPVVGLLAAADGAGTTIQASGLGISFSSDGIVQSVSRHTNNTGEPNDVEDRGNDNEYP